MSEKIEGGYTIWARKTIESDIFLNKPATWFKIWFYIISHVNWKEGEKLPRGTGYFSYSNLKDDVLKDVSPDVYKKCIAYLKMSTMISTTKSTRGMYITVLKYGYYQNSNNYEAPQKAPVEAQQKHNRSTTIIKEGKKERKDIEKKERTIPEGQDFISHFNIEAGGKNYTLTDTRKKLLNLRRKIFSLEQIKQAVTNMFSNEFYSGVNDRRWCATPDFILRNDEQIDKFLNISVKKKEYIRL